MTEQAKVPSIRFAGFTDPWEQRELGELVDNIDTGRSVFCSESYGRYPVLGSTSVIGSDSSYDYEGAFLLTARVGANAGNLYRFAGKVKISDNTVFLQAPNSDFLFYLLGHFDLRKLSFGTGQPLVRASELRAVEIDVPKLENEQKSIAEFFDHLDSLITLHQRKYDKLVIFKKSMLEKMFPKDGESVPEIRFAGFTDPWEQRKLGEFSKKNTIKNANGALSETFTNSAEQGVISQLDYFDHDITNDANISGYYVVQPDDFVYNPRISATAPCGPINRNRLNRAGVMSPLYTVFSVDASMDKTYLEHYFKTSRWHDFMFLEGNTGARSDRFSISDATFFEMPIWCPEISEQMAIAKQLETTDTLIALHQRKLELLQNIKKSLLDKMFV